MQKKKREGRLLPDTPDMRVWREEFKEMAQEDHHTILKKLGLDERDIEDFDEDLGYEGKSARKGKK